MNPDPNGQPVSSAQPLGEPTAQQTVPAQAMEQSAAPAVPIQTETNATTAEDVKQAAVQIAVESLQPTSATQSSEIVTDATPIQEPAQPAAAPIQPEQSLPAMPTEVPAQPLQTVEQPLAQPVPLAALVGAEPVAKGHGKFKLFALIGAGILGVFIVLMIIGFFVMKKSESIGSLTSDSYVGLKFKRPSDWVKVSSTSTEMYYHPKNASGKSSSGTNLYSLSMILNANKNAVGEVPSAMSASKRDSYMAIIDTAVSQASKEILPDKATVGCTTDPTYKDKPKKLDIQKAFMAITYSFTCTGANNAKSQSVYYIAVDIIPNDKDIEYLGAVAAATPSIYEKNKTKINEIIASFSL